MPLTITEALKSEYFKKWYPRWLRNELENWQMIYGDFRRRDSCVSALPRGKGPAIIIGSGASLDDAIEYLPQWEGPIFAAGSNCLNLLAHGRHPEYLHWYDAWGNKPWQLSYKGHTDYTKLITHPNVQTTVLKAWKYERYYFLRQYPGHEYFDILQPIKWSGVYHNRGIRLQFKFVSSVTNNQVQVATHLGYSPLFLVGVDVGWKYPGKTRCTSYEIDGKELVKRPARTEAEYKGEPLNHWHEWTYQGNNIQFKNALLTGVANDKLHLIDCSDGMIQELKKANIQDVVKAQGEGFDYTPDEAGEMAKKIVAYFREQMEGK